MRFAQGDEVVLKVEDDFCHTEKTHRAVKVIVIGFSVDTDCSELQYLCYVPQYIVVPDSFTIHDWHVEHYGVDVKYVGDDGCYIDGRTPIYGHVPALPGERCQKCFQFTPHAVLVDGVYLCWACTENPYR